ncbi:MAG: metallophosphoesterase family protein [Acidobacteriota bacterium]
MKYFLLSDIHSNLEALDAVLENARSRGEGEFVVLGDIVGYGANPNEVIARVRDLKPIVMIRGNHEKVIAGWEEEDEFNAAAQAAVKWTQDSLTEENRDFIRSLPGGPIGIHDEVLASHGTPIDEDDYLFSEYDAMNIFKKIDFRICFFGHTHFPMVFALDGETLYYYSPGKGNVKVKIEEGLRYLINPGSIGQPRDRIPDASYAIYESESKMVSFIRVPYDVDKAKAKILQAGLPVMLATRLSLGL